VLLSTVALPAAVVAACSGTTRVQSGASSSGHGGSTHGSTGSSSTGATSAATGTGGNVIDGSAPDEAGCPLGCSFDFHDVIDCNGVVVQACLGTQSCDSSTSTCVDACQATVHNKGSVGCDFYATDMDQYSQNYCFAAFVANTWDTPAHIAVEFAGTTLPIANFARIPSGVGQALTYGPYDGVAGLAPGQVVILFLAGTQGPPMTGQVPCPAPTAMPTTMAQIFQSSGKGHSFHISTDVPVAAYEINPYGGGAAAVTGASLLLPVSAWDTNYVAATASPYDAAINVGTILIAPSMNIIASQDNTHVTMLPKVAVVGGGTLPPGPVMVPYTFTLNKGEMAQFTQKEDLTGSIIQSDNPIGFMAGQPCEREPIGTAYCDHGEQMLPPVKALGSEYVGVMYRPRVPGDKAIWHVVGAVDGTVLTYSSPVGGPAAIGAGQAIDFISDVPFVVKSQDADHPFMLFTYMSGSQWTQLSNQGGYGDPDFVLGVPPKQYTIDYVFFADPTYPETNLVVVRRQNAMMGFDDVTLDCAGVLGGWQPVGAYEWTRIDLMSHNFQNQGNCSTGRHEIKSKTPFGLWVWGWGTPETTTFTANVSYGYPGGMSVQPINKLVIPAQ
jgi:hypothetical protein